MIGGQMQDTGGLHLLTCLDSWSTDTGYRGKYMYSNLIAYIDEFRYRIQRGIHVLQYTCLDSRSTDTGYRGEYMNSNILVRQLEYRYRIQGEYMYSNILV